MTKTFTRATLAGVLALGLAGAAQAQSIPTPANPTPRFPIATDGTPLPHDNTYAGGDLLTGRSAFAPMDGLVGTGLGVAGTAVGTGLGVAGTAVDTGLGTAGAVVDGTTGALGVR